MVEVSEADAGVSFDADDFRTFFEANHQRLLRVMTLVVGDRGDAEEMTAEAFVRILERWGRVRELSNPVGYLYRTALNHHRSTERRRRLARRSAPAPRPDQLAGSDDRVVILAALRAIPQPQRAAVVLAELMDLPDADVAETLGISVEAVRARLTRGRRSLRKLLEVRDE